MIVIGMIYDDKTYHLVVWAQLKLKETVKVRSSCQTVILSVTNNIK
jgi:hypothetical protein